MINSSKIGHSGKPPLILSKELPKGIFQSAVDRIYEKLTGRVRLNSLESAVKDRIDKIGAEIKGKISFEGGYKGEDLRTLTNELNRVNESLNQLLSSINGTTVQGKLHKEIESLNDFKEKLTAKLDLNSYTQDTGDTANETLKMLNDIQEGKKDSYKNLEDKRSFMEEVKKFCENKRDTYQSELAVSSQWSRCVFYCNNILKEIP